MTLLRRTPVAAALLALSGTAWADEAALRRCRAIAEPAARLACYDAIALPKPGQAAPAAPVTPSSSPQARQPAPTAPSPAPTAAAPGPQAERFGLEEKAARAAESQRLDRIESHIPGRFDGWRPNSRIRLANGQVWQVVDDSSVPMQKDDPKVVVRRGVFSNFFMDIEGDNRSPRVRRVQ